jgi:hypothetical protein
VIVIRAHTLPAATADEAATLADRAVLPTRSRALSPVPRLGALNAAWMRSQVVRVVQK